MARHHLSVCQVFTLGQVLSLLLGSQDRQASATTSLAQVMEEIADPLTLLPALPHHIPLSYL